MTPALRALLDRHPAPWTIHHDSYRDANGRHFGCYDGMNMLPLKDLPITKEDIVSLVNRAAEELE